VPARARAVDAFEIQVYDGTADAPGVMGLELHLNSVPNGRKEAEAPELPSHHQSHFTLEPSFGVTPWWEIGAYFQTALRGDGVFAYGGVKLRSKFVTPPGWHPNLRLGANFEISRLPEVFDRDRWGSEVRPIVAWENERWIFAVNPIVSTSLAGPGSDDGPAFEPALMAKVKIAGVCAFGIEYFGDTGPIAHPAPSSSQEHYLFEAFDLLSIDKLELNIAVGEGLTAGSNALVVKAIAGYSWDAVVRSPGDIRGRL
jgi:hypothetical protein